MEKEETIHSRESGLRFTHITIKPVGRMRQAYFSYWFENRDDLKGKPLLTTASGKNAKECIEKVEEFFSTTLKDSEYTVAVRYLGRNVIQKLEFNVEGTFQSMYKAQKWCIDNGYSYGSLDGDNPVAMWKGDHSISKWHNLSRAEKGSCDAALTCDRERPAFIYIFE